MTSSTYSWTVGQNTVQSMMGRATVNFNYGGKKDEKMSYKTEFSPCCKSFASEKVLILHRLD